jgi:hypothetical protein
MRYVCFSCWCERVKLPLELMALVVATPLMLALDGDMVIFATTIVVELGPEVSHSGTCHWCMWQGWRVCN